MATNRKEVMERIDEISNEDLARKGHSEDYLRMELDRVDGFVRRMVMTGSDLSYWHDRHKIISRLLHEGSRSAFL